MTRIFLTTVMMMLPMIGWTQPDLGQPVSAGADTILANPSRWGEMPARSDSNMAHFSYQPRSGWETAALVPYNILGIPFRILDVAGRESIKALDRWGIFDMPPSEHVGLPLPFGTYLLPDVAISGLEGLSYGINVRRPDFLGAGNMAFLMVSSSTKHADKLSGGLYFNLTETWGLQLGAGTSELPLTKFYGLGYGSTEGDESFYNRISQWFGAEVNRDLGRRISVELRSYYSLVEARESGFEVDRGLGVIHADDLPFGFPGESSGWTFRIGLIRDATSETGRAQNRGFQKASVGWFQSTDNSDLSYLQYALDAQHFFPLWFTKRTLGLRAFMNRLENLGTSEIPLTRMATMYHPNNIRGFSDLRFYGMGSFGLSAEYRWPLWVAKGRDAMGLDSYIFSDMGQVYDHTDEIAFNHLNYTGGFGVRLINGEGKFVGRFELGFSDEETVITLTFSQNFQHHGRSLLYGKDPTRRP